MSVLLDGLVRKGFSDEVTSQLDSEAGGGRRQLREERENIPDRGNKTCQGPEPGEVLMC